MKETDYKLYIFDGVYDENDVNFTLFDAAKGYTLIYSNAAPSKAKFFEVTPSVLDSTERQWLIRCQREIIVGTFQDFSEIFFNELLDNFEKELEVEKQKAKKIDKKEMKKWKKAQRKQMKKQPLIKR